MVKNLSNSSIKCKIYYRFGPGRNNKKLVASYRVKPGLAHLVMGIPFAGFGVMTIESKGATPVYSLMGKIDP